MYPFAQWSLPLLPVGPPCEHLLTVEGDDLLFTGTYRAGVSKHEIDIRLTHLFVVLERRGYLVTQHPDYSTRWQAWNADCALQLDLTLYRVHLAN